ncbi:TPA: zeta toxin family protein [Vibrio diabolicus]
MNLERIITQLKTRARGHFRFKKRRKMRPYDSICFLDSVLEEVQYPKCSKERMALAREIALIEDLGEQYDFGEWRQGDDGRNELRKTVFWELVQQTLPYDDNLIKMGFGGAKPRHRVKLERRAMILLGLPASGKSTVAQIMSDVRGAYIVDSDLAKKKLPEIAFPNGAAWVHEESSHIAITGLDSLQNYCIAFGFNMVIPKIGAKPDAIEKLYNQLNESGYKVSLGLVWLPPEQALVRAIQRYQSSKRYIPIFKITREYKENPKEVFEHLKEKLVWESVLHLSSDVKKGEPYKIIEIDDDCMWW